MNQGLKEIMAEVTAERNSEIPTNYTFYILSCKGEVLSVALKKKKSLLVQWKPVSHTSTVNH